MLDTSTSGLSVKARLGLCADLMGFGFKLKSSGEHKNIEAGVLAGRRVAAIRRVLLGLGDASEADEMLSPGVAVDRLTAAMEAAKDAPAHVRVAKAAYAKGILATLRVIQEAEVKTGAADSVPVVPPELMASITSVMVATDETIADPVIDDCIARGAFGGSLRDELAAASAVGSGPDERVDSLTKMKAGAYEKVKAELMALYTAIATEITNGSATEIDHGRIAVAKAAYTSYLNEVFVPVNEAKTAVEKAAKARAKNALATVGAKLIAGVVDQSPITPEAAVVWASAQTITKQAVTRLKKMGYPVDKLRADMADFYRFTRGRVAAVRIHSDGDRRANATSITAHGKVGTINLGSSFDRRVLWHELAHHMEADPVAKMAAGQFIRRRSEDGKSHSLRTLSGNRSYKSDERAYKGAFFNPYVGKIYKDGITEVFAMGIESFSDPETLATRAIADPQTLEFVAGFVKADIDPLGRAHAGLREMVTGMQEEVTKTNDNLIGALIKRLADSVTLTPDTDAQWMSGMNGPRERFFSTFKQVGRLGDGVYLLSGRVSDVMTRRKKPGFLILRLDGSGGMSWFDVSIRDVQIAKATYAVYLKTGAYPYAYKFDSLSEVQEMSK